MDEDTHEDMHTGTEACNATSTTTTAAAAAFTVPQAVELFKQMRQLVPAAQLAALPPQLLFRVYACAVRAAISAEDFETADECVFGARTCATTHAHKHELHSS